MPIFHCPTCKRDLKVERPGDAPYRPFCCRRCQLIDLYHWMSGSYRVSDPLAPDPHPPPVLHARNAEPSDPNDGQAEGE